jgi:FkbM family methyltransferase
LTLGIQYQEIFLDGIYDYVTDKERPFIVDCGGNIGLSVTRYKHQHPGSRILVFGADPQICEVLKQNVETLGLTEVEVLQAAAWTCSGEARFKAEGSEGGRLEPHGTVIVPTFRLADFLTDETDMLKLDIEGAEWAVLDDLCQSSAIARVKHLIIEFHGWTAEARRIGRILDALTRHGFTFTFPWSFCEPGLADAPEPTPFPFAKDAKFILFLHAWKP